MLGFSKYCPGRRWVDREETPSGGGWWKREGGVGGRGGRWWEVNGNMVEIWWKYGGRVNWKSERWRNEVFKEDSMKGIV